MSLVGQGNNKWAYLRKEAFKHSIFSQVATVVELIYLVYEEGLQENLWMSVFSNLEKNMAGHD